jgi:CubicO group peptidase (beta-lactamase class C family)
VLLAEILFRATGLHADEYARRRLFEPIGIDRFYWKKTPTGIADTEGGLYLRARDLARLGYLYLNDGVWDGRRILPEGWVAATMEPAVEVPGSPYAYGFQWWLLPHSGDRLAYTGLGYGGQRLFIVPEQDLVAVFTGWNIYDRPQLDPAFALRRVLEALR